MNSFLEKLNAIGKKCFHFIDGNFVTPISRAIYFLFEKFKNNPIHVEKFLNRPLVLVYISLGLAIVTFFFESTSKSFI